MVYDALSSNSCIMGLCAKSFLFCSAYVILVDYLWVSDQVDA